MLELCKVKISPSPLFHVLAEPIAELAHGFVETVRQKHMRLDLRIGAEGLVIRVFQSA